MKAALALVLLVGCADQGESPAIHTDLRAAFAYNDDAVKPVGVAVTPDGGRYVFEETHGLFKLDGDSAQLVVGMTEMPSPGPGFPAVKQPYTDMVALGPDLFALTAIGDGYLLDTRAMTLSPFFCYVPSGDGGGAPVSTFQRTNAVTFDSAAKKIWAQPNTLDAAEVYQYGQIASYERETGANLDWIPVTPDLNASGMAVLDGTVVYGQGTQLVRWDASNYQVMPVADLGAFGVRSIAGLSVDAKTGSLLVVDDLADELIDIDLSSL